MNDILRVGIIGCGRIAGHHCDSIVGTKGAKLVAVCDIQIQRAHQYREKYKVSAYDNFHEMLKENPEINVVVIATPSGMHFEHALDVMNLYQKNVVVEKPTFMNCSQIKNAYNLALKKDVAIFPIFQNRHNLAVKRVLQGVRSGELGRIRSASIRVRWCRPQRYYDLAPWRGTFSMDGGCLTNQGIHHLDLLRMMCGEALRVSSVHKTQGANIEVEDAAMGLIEFENNIIATVDVTTAARPIDYEASLSLVCEKGLAQIGGIAVNELQIYSPEPEDCSKFSEDFSGNVYGNGHIGSYKEIINHMKGVNCYSVTKEDVMKSVGLLNAFYLSDERRSWINAANLEDSLRLGRSDEDLAKIYRTLN